MTKENGDGKRISSPAYRETNETTVFQKTKLVFLDSISIPNKVSKSTPRDNWEGTTLDWIRFAFQNQFASESSKGKGVFGKV